MTLVGKGPMKGQPIIEIDKREGGRLGHEQLQALEHSNRMISEHLALMKDLSGQVDTMVDTFIPIMRIYVENIQTIRITMAKEVAELLRSSRELKGLTSSSREIIDFCEAAKKLSETLTPELVTKLRSVLKETV